VVLLPTLRAGDLHLELIERIKAYDGHMPLRLHPRPLHEIARRFGRACETVIEYATIVAQGTACGLVVLVLSLTPPV
jgi:hypothetical protein